MEPGTLASICPPAIWLKTCPLDCEWFWRQLHIWELLQTSPAIPFFSFRLPSNQLVICRLELMLRQAYLRANYQSLERSAISELFSVANDKQPLLWPPRIIPQDSAWQAERMKWKKTRCLPTWLLNVSYWGVYRLSPHEIFLLYRRTTTERQHTHIHTHSDNIIKPQKTALSLLMQEIQPWLMSPKHMSGRIIMMCTNESSRPGQRT